MLQISVLEMLRNIVDKANVLGLSALVLTVSSCLTLMVTECHADSGKQPNIVYLLADDLGRNDVGWRNPAIKTPNLDKLAKNGAQLDQYYVQPVCSPTRAAFLTGRYPIRYGLQVGVVRPWAEYGLPLEERLLSQSLKAAGYETAIVGKWHLGHIVPEYLPTKRGFDHQYGHYNGALDYFTHDRDGGHDWHKNDKANYDEGYSTHLIGKEASRIIQERDRKKPLFLYVPFNGVHTPLQVPESYTAPYGEFKNRRKTYAGMITALDEAVGKIVAAIEEQGEMENTLFIFSSDNGGPNPGQISDNGELRAGKGTVYEGGVRVCAFASWKGKIQPASVVNEPIHVVDWYPTLLKLAGAKVDQPLPIDGLDVWDTISKGAPSPRQETVLNITPNGGAIRVGDWKLIRREQANGGKGKRPPFELFNIREDIQEKNDLSESQPEKLKELSARYAEIAKSAAAPLTSGNEMPAGFKVPKVWGEK